MMKVYLLYKSLFNIIKSLISLLDLVAHLTRNPGVLDIHSYARICLIYNSKIQINCLLIYS